LLEATVTTQRFKIKDADWLSYISDVFEIVNTSLTITSAFIIWNFHAYIILWSWGFPRIDLSQSDQSNRDWGNFTTYCLELTAHLILKAITSKMYGMPYMYQPMNEQAYIQLNRAMPVPILEDSDIESNVRKNNLYIFQLF